MAGKNRQRKSSLSFLFVFNMFKNNKGKGGIRKCDNNNNNRFEGGSKVWHISDYDKERWGVADPQINNKAREFIHRQKIKLVSDLTN